MGSSIEKLEAEARRSRHKSARVSVGGSELRVGFDDRTGTCWHMIDRQAVGRDHAKALLQSGGIHA